MTISKKINAMIFVVVGLFAALLSVLIIVNLTINRNLVLQERFRDFELDLNAMNNKGKALLIGNQVLSGLMTDFTKARQAVTDELTAIQNSTDVVLLNAAEADSFKRIKDQYAVLAGKFDQDLKNLQAVWDDNGKQLVGVEKYGIYRIASSLQRIDPASTMNIVLSLDIDHINSSQFGFEDAMLPLIGKIRDSLQDRIAVQRNSTLIITVVGSTLIILLNIFLGLLFTRRFKVRVRNLEATMQAASCRDITQRSSDNGSDEIRFLGDGLNKVLTTLQRFIGQAQSTSASMESLNLSLASTSTESTAALNEITSNVESISSEIARLSDMNSKSAEEAGRLKNGVEGLLSDMERESTIVKQSIGNAESISAKIAAVYDITSERRESSDELVRTTVEGGERLESTHDLIDAVTRDIESVTEIIDLINHIADQTNILSLNAAIESAHAGEAGKGFAIVAQEIQKLAESTAENSSRIAESLRAMTEKIQQARQTSEYSQQAFSLIQEEVQAFSNSFKLILGHIDDLNQASTQISSVSRELSEISVAVTGRAATMNSGIIAISDSVKTQADYSSTILSGIREIDLGARDVLQTMIQVETLASESKAKMGSLVSFMASYKTDHELDSDLAENDPALEGCEDSSATTAPTREG